MSTASATATIGGHEVKFSRPEKVLWPEGAGGAGFTKGEMIAYYSEIAEWMLPHLKDRAVTRKRYPDGVEKPFFFEKNCPAYKPAWMKTAEVESRNERGKVNYCVVNNLESLLWLANLAAIEFHTQLSFVKAPERPTMMVFDMDPGEPAGLLEAGAVALRLREVLKGIGLWSCAKMSGGKGVHVYVPLNSAVTFEQTKSAARTVAQELEKSMGDMVTTTMKKEVRKGKVFMDWSQNDRHKTTCCVYSLRARARPTVSMPVTWEELAKAVKGRKMGKLVVEASAAVKRAREEGDLFEEVLTRVQRF